jgi:hypothetical protein
MVWIAAGIFQVPAANLLERGYANATASIQTFRGRLQMCIFEIRCTAACGSGK